MFIVEEPTVRSLTATPFLTAPPCCTISFKDRFEEGEVTVLKVFMNLRVIGVGGVGEDGGNTH